MKKRIFIFLFLAMIQIFPLSAQVIAYVNQNKISMGTGVVLTLSSSKSLDGAPDWSVLKKDFDLGAQSQSQNIQYINGQKSAIYAYEMTLYPKREGKIEIPEIVWDNQKSNAFFVEVTPAEAQLSGGDNQPSLFIETTLSTPRVFENAELIYKVFLYDRLGVVEGQILPPQLAGAEIQKVDSDKVYPIQKDGLNYQVVEQTYIIFPTQVGSDLSLDGARFSGAVLKKNQVPTRRSMLDPFGFPDAHVFAPFGLNSLQEDVFVQAKSTPLQVLPKPESAKGKWWLPAKSVEMTLTTPENQPLRMPLSGQVGEPVSLVLTIQARGVLSSQIPQMNLPDSADFKVYADTAQMKNMLDDTDGLIGIYTRSFVLVPQRSGSLVVPPFILEWFDVKTEQFQTARTQAVDMTVVSGTLGNQTLPSSLNTISATAGGKTPLTTAQQANMIQDNKTTNAVNTSATVSASEPEYQKENLWLYFIGGICVGFVLVVLGILILMRLKQKRQKKLPDLYPF